MTQAAALSPARKRWTLLVVILGSGVVFLDTSVVNLALPRIGEELSSGLFGTLEAQSYVANGYFVCRTLQGAAGAVLVPGSLAIITATFQGEEQGRAFGQWAGASAATTILGPFVGGLLVNTVSWRMAFLINLPFLGIAYLATVRFVPESRNEHATGRVDPPGSM